MIYKYKENTPHIDTTCFIAPGCSVIGKVSIGKDSSVWYNAVIRGDMASIIIGENTNIQDGSVLHCVKDVDTVVGSNVTVGHGAILHSCTVGDGSLIGMGSIVLDGVKIGTNCVIGAGTLLTPRTVIPDNSLVVGNPGKVKRQLTEGQIEYIRSASKEYVGLAMDMKTV